MEKRSLLQKLWDFIEGQNKVGECKEEIFVYI